VFQRGDRWAFTVDVAPRGAKRKQVNRSGFATRREARAELTKLLEELGRGVYLPVDRKVTFGVFVRDSYLPSTVNQGLRASTRDGYGRGLTLHLLPTLADVPLSSIDGPLLDALWSRLLASGLSARSVRSVSTLASTIFKRAVHQGVLVVNPVDRSTRPSAKAAAPPAMTTWSGEETARFLRATASDRNGPLWHVLATTGARRAEVAGLKWNDFDADEGTIKIARSLVQVGAEVVEGPPKTAAGVRSISLDDGTVAVLKEHRRRMVAERLAMGAGFKDEGWIFSEPTGAHLTPRNVSMAFGRAVKRHQLPPIRLHDLRHGWATAALAAGVSPKVVSERLGHSGIAITLSVYSHANPTIHRDAADRVAALFGGGA
jgi:integrase